MAKSGGANILEIKYSISMVKINPSLSKKLVRAKIKSTPTENNNRLMNTLPPLMDIKIERLAKLKHATNNKCSLQNKITHCLDKKCQLHSKLLCSQTARSKITHRTYNTRGRADCNTPQVVNLIQCKKRGKTCWTNYNH